MTLNLSFNHLVNAEQLQKSDILDLISYTINLKKDPGKYVFTKRVKPILASLFFESSTRTRFSFESAMLKLGGQYINLENGLSSSVSKGESFQDMGRIMSAYADIIVMRHPTKGSVKEFSTHSKVPVINGGDGANEHPTQSLIDMMTIYERHHTLDNLTIGFWGDLKYARTINSLIQLLSLFSNNKFIFIALPEFQVPEQLENKLKNKDFLAHKTTDLASVLPQLDVLYVTRTQEERFEKTTSETLSPISKESICSIKKTCSILHPLPRVNELDISVDSMKNAAYFQQAENGLFMRMALIKAILRD